MNVQKIILNGFKAVNSGNKVNSFGLKEINGTRKNVLANNKTLHVTAQVKYPQAKPIPLPNNIEAIMSIEIGQFSPLRSRDMLGPVIFSQSNEVCGREPVYFAKSTDPFVENYDCHGAVSLNSAMQSNVPCPFQSKGNTMYLNMPGGQWEQGFKLIAEDMQKNHYINNIKNKQGIKMFHTLIHRHPSSVGKGRFESTKTVETISRKDKLKRAIAEYGSTVIVFHVGISLISLGVCYTLVSSGLDVSKVLSYIPWIDLSSSKVTQNAGTFVAAYAIHKVFAPVRISITLGSTPFIVKYLRNIGFIKPQK